MWSLEELDKAAYRGEDVPGGIGLIQQMYYISVRGIYTQYKNGDLSIDKAKEDKRCVEAEYKAYMKQYGFEVQLNREHLDRFLVTENLRTELRKRLKNGTDCTPILWSLVEFYSGEVFE